MISSRRFRLAAFSMILVAVVAADQATKLLAIDRLAGAPPREILAGFGRLEYAENRGAFLSLGADLPAGFREGLLIAINLTLVIGLGVYLFRGRGLDRRHVIAISLLVAGGVGNLIDRLGRGGAVVDFLVLGVGPLHTGVFNVADFCLTTGALLFAFAAAAGERPPAAGEPPEREAERR